MHELLAILDPVAFRGARPAFDEIEGLRAGLSSDAAIRKALIDYRGALRCDPRREPRHAPSLARQTMEGFDQRGAARCLQWPAADRESQRGLGCRADHIRRHGRFRVSRHFIDTAAFGIAADMRLQHHHDNVFEH
ncbi:hypothetical protein ACS8Y6_17715 [Salinisphaera sp. RV14]|uniref:hypothetical protein n=1 Tax=unclassified Salinisphaera TaxID=2649847 RepID=UPI003F856D70